MKAKEVLTVTDLFLELVKISLIGSLFAVAVMAVRLVLGKAPKWIFVVLWGVVALRLILPFSVESKLSLVPDRLASGQIVTQVRDSYVGQTAVIFEKEPEYQDALNSGGQPVHSEQGNYIVTQKDSLEKPKTLGETVLPFLGWVWLAGVALMLGYTGVSFFLLKRKMAVATRLRDNIWQCEQADMPFVLGVFRPKIYLPYWLTGVDFDNVIAHEQAHITRKDHWWKPLGFLLLSLHWFNPVLWVAYILLCRDIEGACDEKVIGTMDKEGMRAYSTALFNCSVRRRRIAACPLAFGETGVKERIRRVMHYKKPTFWIVLITVVACAVAAVCFLTNPQKEISLVAQMYQVAEVTYENGSYSFSVTAGENSPVYAINENLHLATEENGAWKSLGQLKEMKLTKAVFDDWLQPEAWHGTENAKDIRKNNAKAWRLLSNQIVYYVLQQENGDVYLVHKPNDLTGIRWIFKLMPAEEAANGMVAQSGAGMVPMLPFQGEISLETYALAVHWLTIDPAQDLPFVISNYGEEITGSYTVYDAETLEKLSYFLPSGLSPQTYLFQNADVSRKYIVLASFEDSQVYAFGAKFNDPKDTHTLAQILKDIDCDRVEVIYCGDKENAVTLNDAGCAELLAMLSKVGGTKSEISKSNNGVAYSIDVYKKGESEPISISLWGKKWYSTSEHIKDSNGLPFFYNADLSEVYAYLVERYPYSFWNPEKEEIPEETENTTPWWEQYKTVVSWPERQYVLVDDSRTVTYTSLLDREVTIPVSIPKLIPFSLDAVQCQTEIEADLEYVLNAIESDAADKSSPGTLYVRFEAYLNGDVLSILLDWESSVGSHSYHTYNFDVSTGERLDTNALMEKIGVTDYTEKLTQAAKYAFDSDWSFAKEHGDLSDLYIDRLNATVDPQNLAKANPYLDQDGKLKVTLFVGSMAGASGYEEIISLD